MTANASDPSASRNDAEPIDAEFEPAKPEKRASGGGKALARLAAIAVMLGLAGAIGGAAGWYAASLNPPASDAEASRLAELESQLAGFDARLNAVQDRPLTEMVPTEALRDFDGEIRDLNARLDALAEAPPQGEATDPSALTELETRLQDRLARLEAELETVRSTAEAAGTQGNTVAIDLAPVEERLSTLETSLQQARVELTAALDASDVRATETLEALSAEMSASLEASETRVSDRIDTLEARLSAAEASAGGEAAAVERSAARVLAYTALREAAQGSESFEAERANLALLWPGAPGLGALQPHARRGVPSTDELAQSFPAASIASASGETRRFMGLFELRPSDSAPDSALALTRQAESRLARGDLAGAVEAAGRLEGEAGSAAADWLTAARARLDIETALATLRNALSEDAATQGRSTP